MPATIEGSPLALHQHNKPHLLQQSQVSRGVGRYRSFLKPPVEKIKALTSLQVWHFQCMRQVMKSISTGALVFQAFYQSQDVHNLYPLKHHKMIVFSEASIGKEDSEEINTLGEPCTELHHPLSTSPDFLPVIRRCQRGTATLPHISAFNLGAHSTAVTASKQSNNRLLYHAVPVLCLCRNSVGHPRIQMHCKQTRISKCSITRLCTYLRDLPIQQNTKDGASLVLRANSACQPILHSGKLAG